MAEAATHSLGGIASISIACLCTNPRRTTLSPLRTFEMGGASFVLILLALHNAPLASATFDFPTFDGRPLMAALGSLQQYLGLPSMSSRVVKSASSESHPSYATATVGYGTILKNPPYGAPKPVLRRPAPPPQRPRPLPPAVVKYSPYKGGYFPKFKPQPSGSYEKLKPAVIDYNKPAKEHHFKNYHAYEHLKTESPSHNSHSSYTPTPEGDSNKHGAVIVHQSVRPPIQYYQQPHVATSHQVSNLNLKPSSHQSHQQHFAPHHHQQQQQQHYQQQQVASGASIVQQQQQQHHRSDNLLVDFSRPDPVFAAASMGSDWKPISTPVGGVPSRVYTSDRRADHMAKQVESPPTGGIKMATVMTSGHVDRSDHHMSDFVDDSPSEEIVSAVVFVKKTND